MRQEGEKQNGPEERLPGADADRRGYFLTTLAACLALGASTTSNSTA
jgi:hypothetical protein